MMTEPEPGSAVLTDGERGTMWQRHGSDGLWHSSTGLVLDWDGLLQRGRLILIHNVVTTESREGR